MTKKRKVPPREVEHALGYDEYELASWLRYAQRGESFYSEECNYELTVDSVSGHGCCRTIGLSGKGLHCYEEHTPKGWMKILPDEIDQVVAKRLANEFSDRSVSYDDRETALFKLAEMQGRGPNTVFSDSDTMDVGDAYHCPYCGSPVGQCGHLLLSVDRVSGEPDSGALYEIYEKAGRELREEILELVERETGDEEWDCGAGPGDEAYHMYYAGDPETGERLKEEALELIENEKPEAEEPEAEDGEEAR